MNELKNELIKKSVRDLSPYSVPQTFEGIKLNQNESAYDLPATIKAAVCRGLMDRSWNRYPSMGADALISKIAAYAGVSAAETGCCGPVSSSTGILAGNSSNELIQTLITACCDAGDTIITVSPTFSVYKRAATAQNINTLEVPLNKDFSFNTRALREAAQKTQRARLMILPTPNNPTGTALSVDETIFLAQETKTCKMILALDEAYMEFSGQTALQLLQKFENVIILRTFSKALQNAGIRLGYLLGAKTLTEELDKAKLPFSVGIFQQTVGEILLENQEWLQVEMPRAIAATIIQRERIFNALSAYEELQPIPSKANFVLFSCKYAKTLYEQLKTNGVLLRYFDTPELKNMLRVTAGTPAETDRFLETLKEIMPGQKSRRRQKETDTAEAVLFDMDGVLVDVSASYRRAIRQTVEYFSNTECTPETVSRLKRQGGYNNDWDLTEAILLERGFAIPKEEIRDTFQGFYLGTGFNGLISNERPMVSPELLNKLSRKYKTGIVTGRPREEALYALSRFGMSECFPQVIALEDVPPGKGKPDPTGLRIAKERLNASTGYYLGDTADDMKAATGAGLIPIGITGGDNQRDTLNGSGAQKVYNSTLEAVTELLGGNR